MPHDIPVEARGEAPHHYGQPHIERGQHQLPPPVSHTADDLLRHVLYTVPRLGGRVQLPVTLACEEKSFRNLSLYFWTKLEK